MVWSLQVVVDVLVVLEGRRLEGAPVPVLRPAVAKRAAVAQNLERVPYGRRSMVDGQGVEAVADGDGDGAPVGALRCIHAADGSKSGVVGDGAAHVVDGNDDVLVQGHEVDTHPLGFVQREGYGGGGQPTGIRTFMHCCCCIC